MIKQMQVKIYSAPKLLSCCIETIKKNQVTYKGTTFICNDYFLQLFNPFINILHSLTSE